MKANAETLTLKKENNGVFLGNDGYLLERFERPEEQLQRNIDSLKYFSNKAKNSKAYFLLVPTSVEVYPDKLPLYAELYSQREIITSTDNQLNQSMPLINVTEKLMRKKDEPIYFRTDHHWTMRGAYYAYREVAKAMGFIPYEIDDFNIEEVSADFYGTFYTKANAPRYKPDKIEVFKPRFEVKYDVEYVDEGKSTTALYEPNFLSKRDQYSYFLNGNHSLVKISSTIKNGRKLAVIKDSYAHALIPFLVNHFEEVHVMDLRYYHMNPYKYLADHQINDVLFLYNVANFSKDTNLIWLKQ
nr:DHHW family protein [Fredinandcohnia sp. SECRCQ15]